MRTLLKSDETKGMVPIEFLALIPEHAWRAIIANEGLNKARQTERNTELTISRLHSYINDHRIEERLEWLELKRQQKIA